MSPEARLAELGIELPAPPLLPFTPRLRRLLVHDGIGYLSGNGDITRCGRVGDDVDLERAREAARATAHLMCRTLREELGSLDRVERWLKVLVLVRSAPGFGEQPAVANGFSEAIVELWGEDAGLCARSAIGVAELPGGLAVEVEAAVAIR
ncbi:MAG: RidA family protein [Actinobacteria bacterium]|nr:RidA family protein [Actinomycetota bacterium]MBV8598497.1 RidA family protein [Actinomycetota bacterium]